RALVCWRERVSEQGTRTASAWWLPCSRPAPSSDDAARVPLRYILGSAAPQHYRPAAQEHLCHDSRPAVVHLRCRNRERSRAYIFSLIWICPPCSLTSNTGCSCVAGPFSTRPSSSANSEPCQGHTTDPSLSVPSESGPPRCA